MSSKSNHYMVEIAVPYETSGAKKKAVGKISFSRSSYDEVCCLKHNGYRTLWIYNSGLRNRSWREIIQLSIKALEAVSELDSPDENNAFYLKEN